MSSDTHNSILAIGAYLPRWRLARSTVNAAIGWARGRPRGAKGQRTFAHWDEDSITMAVEASAQALAAAPGQAPEALMLASTSLPFADRSNAGLVREALGLSSGLVLGDLGGNRRCASTVLAQVLQLPGNAVRLVCASECVDTQPGSEGEGDTGHGAAAVLTGPGPGLARLKAARSMHEDFLDRYRLSSERFDYRLESRWHRDAGVRRQLKVLIRTAMGEAGIPSSSVDWLLLPFTPPVCKAVARDCDLGMANGANGLYEEAGLCGSAHPVLMLSWALQRAEPGQHLVLVGAGQGFDVLVLEVTASADELQQMPVREEKNYTRYLGIRGLLSIDNGIRAERDNRSAQAAAYRRHEDIHGLLGGRCADCGLLQYPRAELCVHCHSEKPQQAESLAALPGEVNSFTEDWLAYTPRPPLIFGNVHFPDGANIMMEFTDFEAGELSTGQQVRVAFRIKDIDQRRGFRRYFWKPAPPLVAGPGVHRA